MEKGQAASVARDLPLFVEDIANARETLQTLIDAGQAVRIIDFQDRKVFVYADKTTNSTIRARIWPEKNGNKVLAVNYNIGRSGKPWDWVWFGAYRNKEWDWSEYAGVVFLLRGSSTSNAICFQIHDNKGYDFKADTGLDDCAEWRLCIISLRGLWSWA